MKEMIRHITKGAGAKVVLQRQLTANPSNRAREVDIEEDAAKSALKCCWPPGKKGKGKKEPAITQEQIEKLVMNEQYLKERRPLMLTFNLAIAAYLGLGLVQNFQKLVTHDIFDQQQQKIDEKSVQQQNPQYQPKAIIGLIITAVIILSMLIFHLIMTTLMAFKLALFARVMRYMSYWAILLVGLFTHLQFNIQGEDLFGVVIGLYIVLPLAMQTLNEQRWFLSLLFYLAIQVYPVYLFLTDRTYLKFEVSHQVKAVVVLVLHSVFLGLTLACRQKTCLELLIERQNVSSVKREYAQILEQMPEGILIINKRGKIEFINEELRDVLNVEEIGQESQGLYVKMFKSYNLEDDIDNQKEDDCISDCIHTIVEDDAWHEDEDRFFELDICGCETTRDEDRIFTQIRKLKIEFKEQPATMLLIRNISHIIKYEKARTQGKYQELLTATTSHEMLTPLNSIINLSYFVEVKLKKLLASHRQRLNEDLQQLQKKRQQLQLLAAQAGAHPGAVHEDIRNKKQGEEGQADSLVRSVTLDLSDMDQLLLKSPKLHQKLLMQSSALMERDYSESIEYQHVIKSSAKILQFIVKDLIDLMNIKGGNFNPQVQNANYSTLQEACQEIIDCYKIQAREKNIYLRITMVSDDRLNNRLSGICFDRQRYQQILLNIVQNGVKFTATGGIELVVEVELNNEQKMSQTMSNHSKNNGQQNFIKQSTSMLVRPFNVNDALKGIVPGVMDGEQKEAPQSPNQQGCELCGFIVTKVKDTGVGMRKEVVQKLFKLFALSQKSSALSKGGIITTQGIGLGLSISKQLVEILGGIIRINTAPNKGTEVKFIIPFMCTSCLGNYQANQVIGGPGGHVRPRSQGKITQIFKSLIGQDSIDYRSELASHAPTANIEGSTLIGAQNAAQSSGAGAQANPPGSPSLLRSWQPFGGDINFIPNSNHNEKLHVSASTSNHHNQSVMASGSGRIRDRKQMYQGIKQCSLRKKKNSGAESLYDIFGDKAPLSNGTPGLSNHNDNARKDEQFFFQSQESNVTSDPQTSHRNILQPNEHGLIVQNQAVFNSMNYDMINDMRKLNRNSKLMGIAGDFDTMSANNSDSRKHGRGGTLTNSISEYGGMNQGTIMQKYQIGADAKNEQTFSGQSKEKVEEITNNMFCNRIGGTAKKTYEFSKFKNKSVSNQKMSEQNSNKILVLYGSSDLSGGLQSPKDMSINDEISTSRDYLVSPANHRILDRMPNDLKLVGVHPNDANEILNHAQIKVVVSHQQNYLSVQNQRVNFERPAHLVNLGVGKSEEALLYPDSSRPTPQGSSQMPRSQGNLSNHTKTDQEEFKQKPQIGVMISEMDSSKLTLQSQKPPVFEIIISDGSLLNNPNQQMNNNHLIPAHETSAYDFDAEKKYTAFFPVMSTGNEDGEFFRQNFQSELSRKSNANKKPQVNFLMQGLLNNNNEQQQQQLQSEYGISSAAFKSMSNTNNQVLFKTQSLKNHQANAQQNDQGPPSQIQLQGEDMNIKTLQHLTQEHTSKSTLKEIAGSGTGTVGKTANILDPPHKSSIHLIQNWDGNAAQGGVRPSNQGVTNPPGGNRQETSNKQVHLTVNKNLMQNILSTLHEAGADAEEADEETKNYYSATNVQAQVSPFTLYNPQASVINFLRNTNLDSDPLGGERIEGLNLNRCLQKQMSVGEGIPESSLKNERFVREFCGSQKSAAHFQEESKGEQSEVETVKQQQDLVFQQQLSSRRIACPERQAPHRRQSQDSQASRGILSHNSKKSRDLNTMMGSGIPQNQPSRGLGQYCQCPSLYHGLGSQSDQNAQIMIVDDNTFNLMPLELILGSLNGLQCHKAFNGLEAVNLYKKSLSQTLLDKTRLQQSQEYCYECGLMIRGSHFSIDNNLSQVKFPQYKLILMDLNMPIMDGFEATQQIFQLYQQWKKDHAHSVFQGGLTAEDYHLSVVAITAFVNDESIRCCYEVGMQDVMHKPVVATDIKKVLDKYYYPSRQQNQSINSVNNNNQQQQQNKQNAAMTGFPGGY